MKKYLKIIKEKIIKKLKQIKRILIKLNDKVVDFSRTIARFHGYIWNFSNHESEEKEKDLSVARLQDELKNKKQLNDEKENLIKLRDNRIEELNQKHVELKNTIKDLNIAINQKNQEISKLKADVRTKERQRRANASSVGAKQKSINSLNKKLEAYKEELSIMTKENAKQIKEIKELRDSIEKNEKIIEFYKSNRKNPTVEEVKAYDFQFKEVEKRIKDES